MKNGLYIYGIINSNDNRKFGPIKINDSREIHTLNYQDTAAVVSNASITVCEPTRENALEHEKVIREIMKECTVIPMGFGTIVGSENDAKEVLKKGYQEFKNLLKRIEGKIQIDVKVLWNKNNIYMDVLNENKKIQELTTKRLLAKNKKIELGKLVKSALDEKRKAYIKETQNALSNFSKDLCENKLTDEQMIMNTSFLVDKNRENEFYEKVDELERKYKKKLEIIAVGPLPPYNFTKMEMMKIDFRAMDNARKTLGLGMEASMKEIEQAHRSLAYKYHPDRNPAKEAERQFKEIEKAYTLLTHYCKHHPSKVYSFRKKDVEHAIMIIENSER